MNHRYDEATAVASVSKKAVVNLGTKTISYNPNNHQIGNGTWGKIDFLTKYCGWHLVKDSGATVINKTSSSSKKRKQVKQDDENKPKIKKMKMKK